VADQDHRGPGEDSVAVLTAKANEGAHECREPGGQRSTDWHVVAEYEVRGKGVVHTTTVKFGFLGMVYFLSRSFKEGLTSAERRAGNGVRTGT